MKRIFVFAMTLLSLSSFAQNSGSKENLIHYPKTPAYLYPIPFSKDRSAQNADSAAIKVSYQQKPIAQNIAFIVNGQLIPYLDPAVLDVHVLGSFNVNKKDTVINGHTYNGCITIQTKNEYAPDYITLNELKRKHTSIETGPSIFMINDRIINDNYDKVMVDEKYIQKIEVSKIRNPEENVEVNVIKLITRTKTNTKKSEEFWIRGNTNVQPAANYLDNGFGVERQKAAGEKNL